jgi:hypothetical protein
MNLKVIARNYHWDCGDGCCSESRMTYELMDGTDKFYVETLYSDPASSKESFLSEIDAHGNFDMFEALRERLKQEENQSDELIKVLDNPFADLHDLMKLIPFEFIHTEDEYDNY